MLIVVAGVLRIAVAQPRCAAHDVGSNAFEHAAHVAAVDARVVAFPELSLTGYELDAERVDPSDPRLRPVVEACAARRSVAFVGAPVAAHDGGRSIGMLRIDGAGASIAYRKMFLGAEETPCFVSGTRPAVVTIDGWRIGLGICKDTGVDEHASRTAELGIDGYLAGVCERAVDFRTVAARARRVAADHKVWVATASFAGPTGGGFDSTAGGSGVWSRDGVELVRLGGEIGEVGVTTVS